MYKQNSEIKFILVKLKDSETHETKVSYVEAWDGMECIGISDSMDEAVISVNNYILNQNYIENNIDWEKIPIDTKVLVSNDGETWYHRHFGGTQDGSPTVYADGKTSWTKIGKPLKYMFIKLAEE